MSDIALEQVSFSKKKSLAEFDVIDSMGKNVGFAQLRLVATKSEEMPEGFESNVYYEIKPEYRKRGYATQVLRLLGEQAAKHGLDRVIATANSDNTASIRVIEQNGGELEGKDTTSKGMEVKKFSLPTV